MSCRPWMPMWIADYLADTQHLSITQSGAYLHLIFHYWQHGGLPDDDVALARICRMRVDTWRRWHRETISQFFDHGSGCHWSHKRIEAELARASEFSTIQRGRVKKRWQKTDTRARATPEPHSQKEREEGARAPKTRNGKHHAEAFSVHAAIARLCDRVGADDSDLEADSSHQGPAAPRLISQGRRQ